MFKPVADCCDAAPIKYSGVVPCLNLAAVLRPLKNSADPTGACKREVARVLVQRNGIEDVTRRDPTVAISHSQEFGADSGRSKERFLDRNSGFGDRGYLASVGPVLLACDACAPRGALGRDRTPKSAGITL